MATAMLVARPPRMRAEASETTDHSLVRVVPPRNWMIRIEEHPAWEMLSQVNMTMRAEVLLVQFRVRDLLALAAGQVFETSSPETEDVPIQVGNVQLGWGEFEVIEQRMALRVTRLD